MSYLSRQKFDIRELAAVDQPFIRVLVAEPEEYLLALYAYHISRHNFHVRPCPHGDLIAEELVSFKPHACICDAMLCGDSQATARKLSAIRRQFPAMVIVTIGGAQEDVRELMNAGVSAHIDRRTSRPADIAEVLNTILYNS